VKQAFSREVTDVRESVDELGQRLDADLTRREAELDATPEQKLDGILDEINDNDSVFDELRARTDEGNEPT
jgi:hypothetical protein